MSSTIFVVDRLAEGRLWPSDDDDDDDGNNQYEEDEDSDDGACASDPFSNRISQAGAGWIRAAHLVTAAAAPGKGLEV